MNRRAMTVKARTVVGLVLLLIGGGLEASAEVTNQAPIHVLVQSLIAENGGKTNKLGKFKGPPDCLREVKKDDEGVQLFFRGDQLPALEAMIKEAYGEPPFTQTNSSGKTMFQYSKNQLGVGLSCRLNSGNAPTTHLVILGQQGLAALSGKSAKPSQPAAFSFTAQPRSAQEIRARDVALKAAVDRGFSGDLDGVVNHSELGWVVGVFTKAKGPDGIFATVALDDQYEVRLFIPVDKPK
jgi:hypothetical protein